MLQGPGELAARPCCLHFSDSQCALNHPGCWLGWARVSGDKKLASLPFLSPTTPDPQLVLLVLSVPAWVPGRWVNTEHVWMWQLTGVCFLDWVVNQPGKSCSRKMVQLPSLPVNTNSSAESCQETYTLTACLLLPAILPLSCRTPNQSL